MGKGVEKYFRYNVVSLYRGFFPVYFTTTGAENMVRYIGDFVI